MPRVLVVLADGFEEIEAVAVIDILRRASIDTVAAGLHSGEIVSTRKIKITPDTTLDTVKSADFDMLFLPGGQPGTNNLKADARVIALLKEFHAAGKYIGAICAAPSVLAVAGLLAGKRVTSFPDTREQLGDVDYSEEPVVIDGKILTSRGAGTAADAGFAIVSLLIDTPTADRIRKAMQFPIR